MKILDEWIEDLPQQFQGKENIEILLKAFSKQLEEVATVFKQLDNDTDLDTAEGKNLDMVGDIEVLSRKDACYILRSAEKVLTDDLYRSVLQYKAIQNNTDCTYYEIMDAMSLLWDTENVTYEESPERPATIIMRLPTVSMDAIDPSVGRILSIKPSGVGIVYIVGFWAIAYFGAFERIINPNLTMRWKQLFYSFAMNGLKLLDGTWPLDGETLLDSAVISMPVSVSYAGISASTDESIAALVSLAYREDIEEKTSLERISIISKLYEVGRNIRTLDGTWLLDGETYLDSEYWGMPSRLINGSFVAESDETIKEKVSMAAKVQTRNNAKGGVVSACKANNIVRSGSAVRIRGQTEYEENLRAFLISRRNMWTLDGTNILDGNRYLNAILTKEAI